MASNGRKHACQMTREERLDDYRAHRINYLPIALDNARRKVRALEIEATRYGMTDLLEGEQ